MWKKRLLIISILGNIFSLFLIGVYFLTNSWFFHAELGSTVGIKPDYLIQLNNEGVLYDYRQMIRIASGIRSYKLINSLESDNYHIYKSIYNHQIFIGQVDQIHQNVNVNIRMYNFDDVQCTVIPSVAYGFVTGMNLQLC